MSSNNSISDITKYFITNSIESPHIYLIFKGVICDIRYVNTSTIYILKDINIVEYDEAIEKYINGNTFDFAGKKPKKINIDIKNIDELNISKVDLFNKRYGGREIVIPNNMICDTYKDAVAAINTAITEVENDINNMLLELKERKVDIDKYHVL